MSDSLKIITNNQYRYFIYGHDLPADELARFDWLDSEENGDGFFKYRGHYYHVSEFMAATGGPLAAWHGYASDSYFSGILIKLSSDGESVMVGRYYS